MLFAPEITKRRRPSLTPMIDVVFLLLVFFMLAAVGGGPLRLRADGGMEGAALAAALKRLSARGVER
ncbi:MAG: biopolymer transporter ExbD, partial [Pseudomonadota bacterium]